MTLVDSETQSHTSTAMDDDEQIKTERRQDSVNMAWNPAAARQAHRLRLSTPSDYVSRRVRVYSEGSRHGSGQPAVHGVTSHCSLPVVLLSVAASHDRRSTIPRLSLHLLLDGLLQRSTHWDSQGLDGALTTATTGTCTSPVSNGTRANLQSPPTAAWQQNSTHKNSIT